MGLGSGREGRAGPHAPEALGGTSSFPWSREPATLVGIGPFLVGSAPPFSHTYTLVTPMMLGS